MSVQRCGMEYNQDTLETILRSRYRKGSIVSDLYDRELQRLKPLLKDLQLTAHWEIDGACTLENLARSGYFQGWVSRLICSDPALVSVLKLEDQADTEAEDARAAKYEEDEEDGEVQP